ncbi:MAG: hypothetical protein DRH26_00760 [Deltaproteobacteria bacterium]|nr:MAG: hypothetical protein DRH26_00760 [Deltaproteobacteria bacterium]
MASLHDDVLDNGLSVINDDAENLYLCDTLPTTFTHASDTYKLGTKELDGSVDDITGPSDRTGGGREVVIAAITDGVVDAEGLAGYYGITDDSTSRLLAAGSLASPQTIYVSNPFTTAEFAIGIPDPA